MVTRLMDAGNALTANHHLSAMTQTIITVTPELFDYSLCKSTMHEPNSIRVRTARGVDGSNGSEALKVRPSMVQNMGFEHQDDIIMPIAGFT